MSKAGEGTNNGLFEGDSALPATAPSRDPALEATADPAPAATSAPTEPALAATAAPADPALAATAATADGSGASALCVAVEGGGPRRVGPYRIGKRLGVGGMGAVYAAERDDDEYKRVVAIKNMSYGLGSEDAIARLRDERQILASLDHPNIVRLLDGGRTEDGRPYLVMERVEGAPIPSTFAAMC